MSLQGGVKRVGAHGPSFLCKSAVSAVDHEDGWDIIDLVEAFGLAVDPWQEWSSRGLLDDGKMVSWWPGMLGTGLSVTRQNGKNGALEVLELGQMVSHSWASDIAYRA